MNNNLKISSTRVRRLFNYLEDFEKGHIQVPPFQRDFVWTNKQKLQLLDSIKRGYPIGSILFWKPYQELDNQADDLQTVGAYHLPKRHTDFFYILDGYQRLSTLFGCLVNPEKTELEREEAAWKKGFDIIYDLEKDEFTFNKKTSNLEIYKVPLYKFIDGGEFYEFQTDLIRQNIPTEKVEKYLDLYKDFGTKISSYDIPSTDLIGGTIKEAVDIFSRLNSRGKPISNDWKISALSYNKEKNFRLGTEIDNLFSRLQRYNYFHSPKKEANRKLILKCITNSFGDIYFDTLASNDQSTLEDLAVRANFIDVTRKTFAAIEKTVEFLFKELKVLDNKLIPYNIQFIFITDFFNQVNHPNKKQLETLKKWFWTTTYSNYFTISLSQQRKAYKKFQAFIKGENKDPIYYYNEEKKFKTAGFPPKINMGSVRANALALFMLNFQAEILNLKIDTTTNYEILKLFKEEDKISENAIFYIKPDSNKKNKIDWFESSKNYDAYFITTSIKDANLLYNEEEILELRKYILIQFEKAFVESLDIDYTIEESQLSLKPELEALIKNDKKIASNFPSLFLT